MGISFPAFLLRPLGNLYGRQRNLAVGKRFGKRADARFHLTPRFFVLRQPANGGGKRGTVQLALPIHNCRARVGKHFCVFELMIARHIRRRDEN